MAGYLRAISSMAFCWAIYCCIIISMAWVLGSRPAGREGPAGVWAAEPAPSRASGVDTPRCVWVDTGPSRSTSFFSFLAFFADRSVGSWKATRLEPFGVEPKEPFESLSMVSLYSCPAEYDICRSGGRSIRAYHPRGEPRGTGGCTLIQGTLWQGATGAESAFLGPRRG